MIFSEERLRRRIGAFVRLGGTLRELSAGRCADPAVATRFEAAVRESLAANGWFTQRGIRQAVGALAENMLRREPIERWAARYDLAGRVSGRVGIIMAGNIPLVGFSDLMCVLMSGREALVKPSSKDDRLIRFVAEELLRYDPSVRITFCDRESF